MRLPSPWRFADLKVDRRADLLSSARGAGESRIANTRCRTLAIAEK